MLLDFSLYCPAHKLEEYGRGSIQSGRHGQSDASSPAELYGRVQPLMEKCRQQKLRLPIARAPYLLRDTKREDVAELLAELTEESIRICGRTGIRYLILRPAISWTDQDFLRFAGLAGEQGVMLLLENQCRSVNGHMVRGACADPAEAAAWIDRLNEAAGEERFGFSMDTGVCNLCGQDMQTFTLLGDRIKSVLLRDCDGHNENAMLPFSCVNQGQSQTDWLGFIRGLRQIGFDGQLVLNLTDTASAFSPLLRPQLIQLAKSVGEYFRWQIEMEKRLEKYDSIVLFGAGNMCRNYLRCYGEKYPPLFTCDNNQALWGTDFFGLEVTPPEALRQLPEDCGVLICNIYYREIERQLSDMGIRNVECFNDEYMPSFYFDRLKGV